MRATAELNVAPVARAVEASAGELPSEFDFLRCDAEAVAVETLKPAEDGDGFILRLYESHASRGRATLEFAAAPRSVRVVDLLEEPTDDDVRLEHAGQELSLDYRPFQVISLPVRP